MGRLTDYLLNNKQISKNSLAGMLQAKEIRGYNPTLEDKTYEVFGMEPNLDRGNILPLPDDKGGLMAPQWLYDLAKMVTLPAHAMQGGSYTMGDVTDMAMNVGMLAAPVGAMTMPKGAIGMNASDVLSKNKLLDVIRGGFPITKKEFLPKVLDSGIAKNADEALQLYKDYGVYTRTPHKTPIKSLINMTDEQLSKIPQATDLKKLYSLIDSVTPENYKNIVLDAEDIIKNGVRLNSEGKAVFLQEGDRLQLKRFIEDVKELGGDAGRIKEIQSQKDYDILAKKYFENDVELANNSFFNKDKKPLVLDGDIYREPEQYKKIIEKKLKELGATKDYQSNKRSAKGKSNSSYWDLNGEIIRISDHDVPITPQRTNDLGIYEPRWSCEIVLDDRTMRSLDKLTNEDEIIDYINKLLGGQL